MDTTTRHSRRTLLATGATGGLTLAALALARGGPTFAQDANATPAAVDTGEMTTKLKDRIGDYTHVWKATSPATHEGDTYTLTVSNATGTTQTAYVMTMIMDHHAKKNLPVVAEEITVGAGQSRELTATNGYGTANHFQTTLLANTGAPTELELLIVVVDGAGVETARFTQGAFWIQSIAELRAEHDAKADAGGGAKRRRDRRKRHHAGHDAMPAAATPTAVTSSPTPSA